jgi:hypothetical protein
VGAEHLFLAAADVVGADATTRVVHHHRAVARLDRVFGRRSLLPHHYYYYLLLLSLLIIIIIIAYYYYYLLLLLLVLIIIIILITTLSQFIKVPLITLLNANNDISLLNLIMQSGSDLRTSVNKPTA